MKLSKAALAMIGCVVSLFGQSPFHSRIQVMLGGDEPLRTATQSCLAHGLEKIDGVITVGKEPDYLLTGNVAQYGAGAGAVVALSTIVLEVPERALTDRMLIRSDFQGELANIGPLVASLDRVSVTFVKIGPLDSMPSLCAETVRLIDAITLEQERLHPRGGPTFDTALRNFLLRFGAKLAASR